MSTIEPMLRCITIRIAVSVVALMLAATPAAAQVAGMQDMVRMSRQMMRGQRMVSDPQAMADQMYVMGLQMMRPLQAMRGEALDLAYMRQTIMHHQQAVQMARPIVRKGVHDKLVGLAQNVIVTQTQEISTLQRWLSVRPKR